MAFHVLNRGVGRRTLFETDADYAAFLGIVRESLRTAPMRICAFCLMPNRWHLLLWPERDGQLPAFVQ
jgi:putative transposase